MISEVKTSVILFEDNQVVLAFHADTLKVRCNTRSSEFEGTNATMRHERLE